MKKRTAAKLVAAVAAANLAWAGPASAATSTKVWAKWYNAKPGTIKYIYASSTANASMWPAITAMNTWNNYLAVNTAKIRYVNVKSCAGYTPCIPISESTAGVPGNGGVGGTTAAVIVNGYFQPGTMKITMYDAGTAAANTCTYSTRASMMVHELGHGLGLDDDDSVANDLMNGGVPCNLSSTRTPSVYNMRALNRLYP